MFQVLITFFFFFFFADRKPREIEALTDFMLEDYKNFPKVPELGEETAHFIRQEMEDTWGSEHLSVLPKDEAQHWILGVSTLVLFFRTSISSPFKICKYFKDFCINTLTLFTNRTVSHFSEILS